MDFLYIRTAFSNLSLIFTYKFILNSHLLIDRIDKLPLFMFFLMLLTPSLRGQPVSEEHQERNAWGVQLHNTISYSGFSNALSLSFARNSFWIYGGGRLLTGRVYLPLSGPWGLQGGLRYVFLSSRVLRATAGVDYQLSLSRPYNPHDISTNDINRIHETNLSYGILVKARKNLWVGSDIGFGRYWEVYQDLSMNTTRSYGGYGSLIRLYLHYEW